MVGQPGAGFDARQFIERFRANYVNLHNLWLGVAAAPEGVEKLDPRTRPITEADLPEDVRERLVDWQRSHPGRRVHLYKHLRFEDGAPRQVIEDEQGLPEVDELFTMSRTLTLNTAEHGAVLTEVWVGRIVTEGEGTTPEAGQAGG